MAQVDRLERQIFHFMDEESDDLRDLRNDLQDDIAAVDVDLVDVTLTGTTFIDGSLGVGTSSPSDTLAVDGALYLADTIPANTVARLYNTGGNLYWDGIIINGGGGGGSGTVLPSAVAGRLAYYPTATSTIDDASGLYWDDANGRFGIGTSSPYAKLSVAGQVVGQYFTGTSAATSTLGGNLVLGSAKSYYLGSDRVISANGYNLGPSNTQALSGLTVGVGNIANQAIATALGRSNQATGILGATAVGYLNIASGQSAVSFGVASQATNTNAMAIGGGALAGGSGSVSVGALTKAYAAGSIAIGANITNTIANSLMIGPSDAAKLTILSSGNIGIGTTTPDAKLTVAGDINIDDGSSGLSILGTRVFYSSTTNDSIAIGELAGDTFNSGTTYNVALGYQSGRYASTSASDYNNFIGYQAGYDNTGSSNNLSGYWAGYGNTGDNNNLFGASLLASTTPAAATTCLAPGLASPTPATTTTCLEPLLAKTTPATTTTCLAT